MFVEFILVAVALAVFVYVVWKKVNPSHVAEVTASVETQAQEKVAAVETAAVAEVDAVKKDV